MNIKEILIENPVIAALRNKKDLENVLKSKALVVFVLYGNIMNIATICKKLKEENKIVFVHLDMIEGLKGDQAGIEFIKEYANPQGIITTKSSNIKYAKQLGFYTIQRVFIIDSLFLKTGIKNIHETGPNAVEVMPGVASKIIHSMEREINVPIIAGGLIKTKKDVMDSLAAGAIAISTTSIELWNL
ncbi:glycerol-3-phosphate responsive antiterminator [Clostridium lundense]|uniref:glycerol-3-phosphate responsive antiterminator n=1 Tax=Clostridium lundense TaxID=319475 RepID=UPI000489D819|nr:glycerol-3-phosphate responsive antiterminator [Clostridium lundense]